MDDIHINLAEPEKLTVDQRDALCSKANTIYVSAVSVVEIAIKSSLGKIACDFDPAEEIEASGYERMDFTAEDALPLLALPFLHRDPFDRMLIGQSKARKIAIMTSDPKFKPYNCRLV